VQGLKATVEGRLEQLRAVQEGAQTLDPSRGVTPDGLERRERGPLVYHEHRLVARGVAHPRRERLPKFLQLLKLARHLPAKPLRLLGELPSHEQELSAHLPEPRVAVCRVLLERTLDDRAELSR